MNKNNKNLQKAKNMQIEIVEHQLEEKKVKNAFNNIEIKHETSYVKFQYNNQLQKNKHDKKL